MSLFIPSEKDPDWSIWITYPLLGWRDWGSMIGKAWVLWVEEDCDWLVSQKHIELGEAFCQRMGGGRQYQNRKAMNACQTKTTDVNHQWYIIALKMKDKPFSMTYKDFAIWPCLPPLPHLLGVSLPVLWWYWTTYSSWRRLCFPSYLWTTAGNAPCLLLCPNPVLFIGDVLRGSLPDSQASLDSTLPSFIPCSHRSVCLALCVQWAGSSLREQLCLLSLFPPAF